MTDPLEALPAAALLALRDMVDRLGAALAALPETAEAQIGEGREVVIRTGLFCGQDAAAPPIIVLLVDRASEPTAPAPPEPEVRAAILAKLRAPEPTPEPVVASEIEPKPAPPAPAEPAASPPAPAAYAAPWTAADDERLLALRARGLTVPLIAREIGRTAAATGYRVKFLRARGVEVAPPPGRPKPAPPAPPAVSLPPAPPPRPAVPEPGGDGRCSGQRALAARLDRIGHEAPWTPALDLALAEAFIGRGERLPAVAAALGLDPAVVKARWDRLTASIRQESRGRIGGQARWVQSLMTDGQGWLVAELRARAHSAAAAPAA